MARLKILSSDDINKLYKLPALEDKDRPFVFELDEEDKEYLNSFDNIPKKINYILQVSFFRISQYFFNFTFQGLRKDTWYVIKTYFPCEKFPKKQVNKRHHYDNRNAILKKYGMSIYSSKNKAIAIGYAKELIKQHAVPKYVFNSLIEYFHQHKIVRPSYTTLQEVVSKALNHEKNRLSNKIYTLTDKPFRELLANFLEKDELFYQLTAVKKDQKDFTTGEINTSIKNHQFLSALYQRSTEIIKELGISEQNILHYADLAVYHTCYGLRAMKQKNLSRLYLMCYAHQRYLKISDHLVASFIYKMNYYTGEAESYQAQAICDAKNEDKDQRHAAAAILSLVNNKKVADSEIRKKAYEIMPEEKFQQFIQKIKKPNFTPEFYRWEYYSDAASTIKLNTRAAFKALDFHSKNKALNAAIVFLKSHYNSNKSFSTYQFKDIPLEFIPKVLQRYVIKKVRLDKNNKKVKTIDPDRYEVMLYLQIEKSLKTGSVTIYNSLSYRSLNDELHPKQDWDENKHSIIKSLENKLLATDINDILKQLTDRLFLRYKEINDKIASGQNNKIKLKHNKNGEVIRWQLPYKKSDDGVNNPFYENLPLTSIGKIIQFGNNHTGFMKKFTHILPIGSKKQADEAALSACLVAKGTGIDIDKMKDISDVKEHDLKSTYADFIRHMTLTQASDVVMSCVKELPIFEKYTLADYGIHASIDGQKLETKFNSIMARFSTKYFGFGQGVSAYTLSANWLPLCTKIIGANEHESHYLFDMLNSNTSDIEVAAVSGDMHSINRVNFIILFLFGYRFMPRFTQLDKKASSNLVSFDEPKLYEGMLIKPSKKVNVKLIIKEWDNILRIMATLGLKKSSQSTIVKKLSSYQSNDTLRALIELDQIIMTLYVLDYIDDEGMRKTVHRSLNRGESYHQIRSAIAKISSRKLVGRTEIELTINNECARLLANCIIFYNASLLSGLYEHYKKDKAEDKWLKIIRLSPVAWQHINLIGKYEFYSDRELPNLHEVIQNLISNEKIDLLATT
ncbi:Tn3 family transposase [Legionella rowbothamii]|uniref:Tn3 family transposase n=1 Tax=Legionella rowbothamii TaxID=96229 RepID=UPI001055D294|nr:Tn3 family transposase [Legionella rowbothamii]